MAQMRRGGLAALVATLAACGPLGVAVDRGQAPGPSFALPSPEPIVTSSPASTPTPAPTPTLASPPTALTAPPPATPATPSPASSAPLLPLSPTPQPEPLPLVSPFELRPGVCKGGTRPISGHVYDEHGTEVDGAIVQIESLDMAAPFAISATTSKGAWVAPCVPGGENIQLIATKVGWTRRRRVWADFTQPTIPTIIEFGGDETSAPKPSGGEHFISDRPEVEHVEPAHGAKYVDPGQLRVKLRVSERLPDASRDRLAKAIRVFPLSADAPLPPEDDFSRVRLWSLDEKYPAAIRVGKTAAGDPSIQATSTWNADGTEITLAFDQPLARGATYAIALAAPEAGSILDESGFPLGVGLDGTARATAVPGELLLGAFKEEYLSIEPQRQLIGGDARWQSTHLNATTFTTAP